MNIYFARSIRGNHKEGDQLIYDAILRAIKDAGAKPMFELMAGRSIVPAQTSEQYIYARDIHWIRQCQAMIAEVSNASTGVGYEICYAVHVLHMPVLAVAEKDSSVSAMITGSMNVFQYRDRSDLASAIEEFIRDFHLRSTA